MAFNIRVYVKLLVPAAVCLILWPAVSHLKYKDRPDLVSHISEWSWHNSDPSGYSETEEEIEYYDGRPGLTLMENHVSNDQIMNVEGVEQIQMKGPHKEGTSNLGIPETNKDSQQTTGSKPENQAENNPDSNDITNDTLTKPQVYTKSGLIYNLSSVITKTITSMSKKLEVNNKNSKETKGRHHIKLGTVEEQNNRKNTDILHEEMRDASYRPDGIIYTQDKGQGDSDRRRNMNKSDSSVNSNILPLNTTVPDGYKIILFWTRLYKSTDYRFGLGANAFSDNKCVETKCFTTNNRDMLERADAVVFHAWNMNMTDLPKKRSLKQLFIFFSFEAPPMVRERLNTSELNNYFNFTMTYRYDSDIFMPYGQATPRVTPRNYKCPVKRKSRTVAWLVSNCDTYSKREDYVNELKKHIDVDVFGKCGQKRCGHRLDQSCYSRLNKDYKFYLSFENALCLGYITEKLFRILKLDVIPVVLGHADYSRYAPERSFINVFSFSTPAALGKYLKMLDTNDSKYCKYLEWKKLYKSELLLTGSYGNILDKRAFCRLCRALHDKHLPSKVYERFDTWWEGPGVCLGNVMKYLKERKKLTNSK